MQHTLLVIDKLSRAVCIAWALRVKRTPSTLVLRDHFIRTNLPISVPMFRANELNQQGNACDTARGSCGRALSMA